MKVAALRLRSGFVLISATLCCYTGEMVQSTNNFCLQTTPHRSILSVYRTQYLNCKNAWGDAFAALTNFTKSLVKMKYFRRRN